MTKPDACGITINRICKAFLAVSENSQLLVTSIWFKVLLKCYLVVSLQAGYMLHDRVIRPAEVGVTQEVENGAEANE
jgi:hypothetical protein